MIEEVRYKYGGQYHFNLLLYTPDFGKVTTSLHYNGGDVFGEYSLIPRWGIRVSLGYLQMRQWHSKDTHHASDDMVGGKIYRFRHYGMLALTFRRYVGEKKCLCLFIGPCAAISLYASEQYVTDGEISMPYDDDSFMHHVPDASRALSIPVRWSDGGGVGAKMGLDYEFRSGFLWGVDLNILWIRTFENSPLNPLLCFLSLKLGWNLHAIFCDESMA